jgi:hypothetical protein
MHDQTAGWRQACRAKWRSSALKCKLTLIGIGSWQAEGRVTWDYVSWRYAKCCIVVKVCVV